MRAGKTRPYTVVALFTQRPLGQPLLRLNNERGRAADRALSVANGDFQLVASRAQTVERQRAGELNAPRRVGGGQRQRQFRKRCPTLDNLKLRRRSRATLRGADGEEEWQLFADRFTNRRA